MAHKSLKKSAISKKKMSTYGTEAYRMHDFGLKRATGNNNPEPNPVVQNHRHDIFPLDDFLDLRTNRQPYNSLVLKLLFKLEVGQSLTLPHLQVFLLLELENTPSAVSLLPEE